MCLGNTQCQNIYTMPKKQQITKILQHYFMYTVAESVANRMNKRINDESARALHIAQAKHTATLTSAAAAAPVCNTQHTSISPKMTRTNYNKLHSIQLQPSNLILFSQIYLYVTFIHIEIRKFCYCCLNHQKFCCTHGSRTLQITYENFPFYSTRVSVCVCVSA